MIKLHAVALAAAVTLIAGAAHADTYSFAGALSASDGTFNRPFTLTALSGAGTAVYYDIALLGGATPGLYDFRMTAGFDTFLALYTGLFNPAAPLSGLVALNDDFVTGNTASGSGFSYTLAAGQIYTVVSTSFSNAVTGSYLTTVTSAVPEASSYALMALGLAAIGATVRRRSA